MAEFDEIDPATTPGAPGNIKVASKEVVIDGDTVRLPRAILGYGDAADADAHTDVTPTTPFPVVGGLPLEVSGSGTEVDDTPIPSTDVRAYRWVTIQTWGTWGGPESGALLFEVSNKGGADPLDWHTITLAPVGYAIQGITGEQGPQDGIDATGNTMFAGPISAKFFRARLSDIDTGEAFARALFFPLASIPAQIVMAGREYGSAAGGEPDIGDICHPLFVDANGTLHAELQQGAEAFAVAHAIAPADTITDTISTAYPDLGGSLAFAECNRRTWVTIEVAGTWVGALTVETPSGSPLYALPVFDLITGRQLASITANGVYGVQLPVVSARLVARTWASGSASITITFYTGDRAPHSREVNVREGAPLEVEGSGSAADDLIIPETDARGYRWITLRIYPEEGLTGTPGNAVLEGTIDDETWDTILLFNARDAFAQGYMPIPIGLGSYDFLWQGPLNYRRIRVRLVEGITGGTGTIEAEAMLHRASSWLPISSMGGVVAADPPYVAAVNMDPDLRLQVNAAVVSGALRTAGADVLTPTKVAAFKGTAAIGDNALIGVVGGKKIRVLGYRIQAHGATTITFTDTDDDEIVAAPEYQFEAREGIVATAHLGAFEFETPVSLGLQVNSTAAVGVSVVVHYVEV